MFGNSAIKFITKDSGQRQEFDTGAKRDVDIDKPKYEEIPLNFLKEIAMSLKDYPDSRLDLIPINALLRLSSLFGRGSKKYGENNFQLGIPFKRMFGSILRHVYQYMEGDRTECHLSAIAWGAFVLMFFVQQISLGLLPKNLDDLQGNEERWRDVKTGV